MEPSKKKRRRRREDGGTKYTHNGCKVVHYSAAGMSRCIEHQEQFVKPAS